MTNIINRFLAAVLAAALAAPSAPAAAAAAEMVRYEGAQVGPDEVSVSLSARPKYNAFVTKEPPRLVFEFLNTEHVAGTKVRAGKGEVLKRVRSGQYRRDPSPITRLVLDLARLVAYQADWEDGRLKVRLTAGGAPAAGRDAAASPAALPKKMEAGPSPELEAIAGASDVESGAEARPARPRAAAAKQASASRTRRDILATLPTAPTTLDFDNMEMSDILRLMADKAKINIVYGSEVGGTLTLHLMDVPFNEAFMTVLSMRGLVATQVGENILRVMTPGSLASERSTSVTQTRVIKLKYVKADEVKAAIDAVRTAERRAGSVTVDVNTNSLIITDSLDGIASVERLLAQLDVRPQQILIEAKLVEVKLTKDFHFGIQWDYFGRHDGEIAGKEGRNYIGTDVRGIAPNPPAQFITTSPDLRNNVVEIGIPSDGAAGRGTGVLLPASKIFGAFTLGRITNNYILNATLTAAASQGKVKVLSDPKITTLNGKEASINITTQIPYVTSSVTSTGVATESVSYVTTGIELAVTPIVNADGRITIQVNPKVSQPSAITATAGTTGAPAVDSRDAKTTVMVQDGETIVIGGLITDSVTDSIAKIPLLGDIPFLGWLFKKKLVDRSRVELLIFVTTRVVSS